jgi:hypothetical protein
MMSYLSLVSCLTAALPCFLVCPWWDTAAAAAASGHYKYPPAEIPALLVQSGANLEATDAAGKTALQASAVL